MPAASRPAGRPGRLASSRAAQKPISCNVRFALDATALGRPFPSGIRTILRELVPALALELGEDRLHLWQNDLRARTRPLPVPGAPGLSASACRVPPRLLETLWRRTDWPSIESFLGPLDVFHSLQGRLPAARRARLVLSLNDFRHRRLPHLYPRARWYPREISRADHFLAISETTRQDALRFLGLPPERVTTILLGPPAPHGLDPIGAARARARWGLSGPYLFCPSSSDRRKNAAAAAEALLLVRERTGCPHRLLVVGEPPAGEERRLARCGPRAVVVTGRVSDLDYQALLSGAEAAVHPSLSEGFGFPVLEAFLAGVPQAVADSSALPEVAGGAALLFDPLDREALAGAMERLVTEPALREALAAAGRRRVQDFSWQRTARETLRLYRALAGRARRPVFRRAPAALR